MFLYKYSDGPVTPLDFSRSRRGLPEPLQREGERQGLGRHILRVLGEGVLDLIVCGTVRIYNSINPVCHLKTALLAEILDRVDKFPGDSLRSSGVCTISRAMVSVPSVATSQPGMSSELIS